MPSLCRCPIVTCAPGARSTLLCPPPTTLGIHNSATASPHISRVRSKRANATTPERVGAVERGRVCTDSHHCASAQSSLAPPERVPHFCARRQPLLASTMQRRHPLHGLCMSSMLMQTNPERVGVVGRGKGSTACRHCAAAQSLLAPPERVPHFFARRRPLLASTTQRRQPLHDSVCAHLPCQCECTGASASGRKWQSMH